MHKGVLEGPLAECEVGGEVCAVKGELVGPFVAEIAVHDGDVVRVGQGSGERESSCEEIGDSNKAMRLQWTGIGSYETEEYRVGCGELGQPEDFYENVDFSGDE